MFDVGSVGEADFDVPGSVWDPGDEWAPDGGPAPVQGVELAALPASSGLAMELEFGLPRLDQLDDAALLAVITSYARVAAWAQANGSRALAEFARRRAAEPTPAVYAADEIAVELRLATGTAQHLLDRATALDQHLAPTRALWEQGLLDERRVAVIVDGTRHLPAAIAAHVQALVLPRAPRQTAAQLRAALQRAIIAADPAGAEARHRAAHAERAVQLWPDPDGMATLAAKMSAPDAVGCFETLSRLARGLGAGDPRPMDARRSDMLVGLITGRIVAGEPATDERVTDEPVVGDADAPGPVVADPVADGPVGGDAESSVCANGERTTEVVDVSAAVQVVRPVAPGKPVVQVVIDLDTLRGAAEHPAELAGYGPITAAQARAVAADAVWRRLVTDPLSGVVLDVGRTTYRPPAGLADLVRARDATCRFPGCRRAASGCELDHVIPFPEGPTSDVNLVSGCGRHHHLKHDTDWRVETLPDGGLMWTSPTGATYRTYPRDYRPLPGGRPPPGDDPPPF